MKLHYTCGKWLHKNKASPAICGLAQWVRKIGEREMLENIDVRLYSKNVSAIEKQQKNQLVTINSTHKKTPRRDNSPGQLYSHIQLREIKGLKDRTSYLCTLRRELYDKAAEK